MALAYQGFHEGYHIGDMLGGTRLMVRPVYGVEDDGAPRVADMAVVVHRDSANVQLHLPFGDGGEVLFPA